LRRDPGYFKGHSLHSPPGVQEAAFKLLLQHVSPGASVLDLASGSGGVRARFEDAGFTDLHAVARDPELCGRPPHSTPDHPEALWLDLNGEFSGRFDRSFDLIFSSEVIEHVDSPRHFLGQVLRLLESDGYLLLTTPNVSNWIGRIRFLLFGELRWFDERRGRRLNHISPITDAQMRLMLEASGFDLVASTSGGSFTGPLATLLTSPVSLPFLAFGGRRAWGDCNIYLARKATA
jgi:SAM-dependent methyltransferase